MIYIYYKTIIISYNSITIKVSTMVKVHLNITLFLYKKALIYQPLSLNKYFYINNNIAQKLEINIYCMYKKCNEYNRFVDIGIMLTNIRINSAHR